MHGVRHFAVAIALIGMTGAALPAPAADTGFRIELSGQTGLATIRYGDETIATSKFEPVARYVSEPADYRPIRRGWRSRMAYGCDPVLLQLYGVCGQYGRHGAYGYDYAPPIRRQAAIEDRTVGQASLEMLSLGSDFLPAADSMSRKGERIDATVTGSIRQAPYDPLLDQWRIYYQAKGAFDTSPAPFISTAKLLRSLDGAAKQQPAPEQKVARENASPAVAGGGIRIAISPLSRADLIAWHQNLLNRLGYDAGEPDGVLGPQTRNAIARFEVGMGDYPSGLLNGRVSALLHQAAGVSEPQGGRIVVRRDGRVVLDEAIGIKAGGDFGTHVMRYDGERGWELLAIAGSDAPLSQQLFGTAPENQKAAAVGALARVEMSPQVAARLAELVGPGAILAIGENLANSESNI